MVCRPYNLDGTLGPLVMLEALGARPAYCAPVVKRSPLPPAVIRDNAGTVYDLPHRKHWAPRIKWPTAY